VEHLVARVAAPDLVLAAHVVKADDALVRVVLEAFADQVDERRHGVALQAVTHALATCEQTTILGEMRQD
jgi:hypothetical protein